MAPKELSELTVFNRRKAHLLGQITRIRNSLENVDSPLNQVELRTKVASLSEVKAKIDKLRTESYRVLSDEELMDFEASLDTMEVDADNLEVSLNTLLESSNVNTSELSVKNDFANYNVKLPPINLPEFSGQYIDWLQFKSQFVSLIHDNTCLSDSQKLYYLQSALKGHAKQLQTVNDSYSSLFEALEGRYENKRLIVNSHIAELLNPNKIKFESAFHLRSLIDSIQSHLRALKQLELEPNALCESMLIFVITQRLDDELGLNGACISVRKGISAEISNGSSFKRKLNFLIVLKITGCVPTRPLDLTKIKLPPNIRYADAEFNIPKPIDILLGGDRNLTKFWDLEAIGIKAESSCDPDDQAMQHFKSSVRFNSGRYEVGFPWKSHTQELNDNFSVAEKRVTSLTRRFIRDPTLYIQYSEILKEYESQGIIERVLETEKPTDRAVFYLPHQAVFRQESLTTKMRIVFDASSHEDGQSSLNDCIWSGGNLNPNIFHLIISFRLNTIAITADIERAFLQISLRDEDRDAVRFLFPDIRSNQTDPYTFQVYRFKRVMFGVNVSPFLLSATIKHHIENYREQYPAATEMLDTCLYVDDVISGADDISQALKVSKDAETIMKNASMKLRKWNSNDQTLMRTWEKEGLETHPRHPDDSSKIPSSKVLGIPWDVVHDYFTIDVKGLLQLDTSKPITIRIVLQSVGKIYDPVGFLSPYTIRLKCLLQELWLRKLSWDDELPPDIHAVWSQWWLELPFLSELKIPRKILDSSGDSSEIQSLTDRNLWFHCSGKDNPADLLTRGISVGALTTNSKWWNRSSFLRQIDFQTKGLDEAIPERVYLTEMRKNSNPKEDISLTLTVSKNNFLENIIDISNNYVKLTRVVSFLYRFIHNCRTRITKIKGPLTSQEVSHAENWLIHSLHERELYEEMRKLLAGEPIPMKSKLTPLNVFLDESNIIRPLDKLAIIADKVCDVVGASSICAATTVPPPSQSSSCSAQPTMDSLARQIQELSLQVAELTRGRNSSRHQRYSSDRRRSHSRSRSVNRGSGICYIIAVIKSRPASIIRPSKSPWSSPLHVVPKSDSTRCKQALADAALLAHPSPSAPLALHVDASDYAIGGALHTKLWTLSYSHWLSFPRKLISSEKSYSAYDRELLAIYSALSDTFGICWKLEISQCY
ncbi:integrase catalytic domain-containing protein [Trichonephila clavipes]|nr:integrase catalytic domain-containing protein [Trichonephila clavipes]